MTTKLQIVQQALGDIGLGTYVFDPSPDQLQDALDRMDRLAAAWDGIGIRKGYNLGAALDAESGLPDTAIDPFASLLAIRLAPSYGKQVSPELKSAALEGKNMLMVTNNVIPRMVYPGTLPIGTGNNLGVRDVAYFQDCDPITTGIDGEFQL